MTKTLMTTEEHKEHIKQIARKCYLKHKSKRAEYQREYIKNKQVKNKISVSTYKNLYQLTDDDLKLCNNDFETVKIYLQLKKLLKSENGRIFIKKYLEFENIIIN